jgi:beta-lactamase class A
VIVRRGVEDNKAFRLGLNNVAAARGLMQILLKLAKGEVVSKLDSDAMIEIMLQQKFNEMIPAQLPVNVRVAHKTGWTGKYYHDAGIVYPPNGNVFVLAIMTNGFEKESEAHPFVATLAKMIYSGWLK